MKYIYQTLAIGLCLNSGFAYANPTLKQCIDKCHKKSLNLKDFKHCKDECNQRVKKRGSHKTYHKNYATPAEVMPSVETTVHAQNPQQAELAAVAAAGAAASVLSATTPELTEVQAETVTVEQTTPAQPEEEQQAVQNPSEETEAEAPIAAE